MKLVGFIKQHDEHLSPVSFEENLGSNDNETELIDKILDFLSKGTLILAWMGPFKDLETNKYAEPYAYYSDGTWLWPTYFPYYLKKFSNYKLDMDFVNYLINKNFLIMDVLPDRRSQLEHELVEKLK
jgi:hypothetical protein